MIIAKHFSNHYTTLPTIIKIKRTQLKRHKWEKNPPQWVASVIFTCASRHISTKQYPSECTRQEHKLVIISPALWREIITSNFRMIGSLEIVSRTKENDKVNIYKVRTISKSNTKLKCYHRFHHLNYRFTTYFHLLYRTFICVKNLE